MVTKKQSFCELLFSAEDAGYNLWFSQSLTDYNMLLPGTGDFKFFTLTKVEPVCLLSKARQLLLAEYKTTSSSSKDAASRYLLFELQSQVMADPNLKLRTVVAVPDDKADLKTKCLRLTADDSDRVSR